MILDRVVTGPSRQNAWLVACAETREGVLVDPGAEPARIVGLVDRYGVEPVAIVNTHAHLDTIGAVEELRLRYDIPFLLHHEEESNLALLPEEARRASMPPPARPRVDRWIREGDTIRFGVLEMTVMETPGHSPGSVSLGIDGRVLVGEALQAGSVGRTDVPGGDLATLLRSIRERLFVLPPETVVHSAYGPDTTIGRERATLRLEVTAPGARTKP